MSAQNQALPAPNYPFVDATGKITPVWFQFMSSMWQRTGGGSNAGNVQSVSVNSGSGIISSVSGGTVDAVLNLSLGIISPTGVTATGPISGTTGYFSQGLGVTGPMQFGTFVATPTANTGYIGITDINGTPRKLLIG